MFMDGGKDKKKKRILVEIINIISSEEPETGV